MVMVNLWHPELKVDVCYFEDTDEQDTASNQGYIPLSHLRYIVGTHEAMKKRIEDQNNYITQLEHLIETGTERD